MAAVGVGVRLGDRSSVETRLVRCVCVRSSRSSQNGGLPLNHTHSADGLDRERMTEWECSACTLINAGSASRCTVCDTVRGPTASATPFGAPPPLSALASPPPPASRAYGGAAALSSLLRAS